MFKYAVSEELAPPNLSHALASVTDLGIGEYGTQEGQPRHPVDRASVDVTLEYASKPIAALIELMWWTGARPSELFGLRACDIDRSGDIWVTEVTQHKTKRHGKKRFIVFCEDAQRVLKPLMRWRPEDRTLFSPQDALDEMYRKRRATRKAEPCKSLLAGYEREKAARSERKLGDTYTANAFRRAVQRAVNYANADRNQGIRPDGTRAEEPLPPIPMWTPYQLRHSAATHLRKRVGIEGARVILGHSTARTSEDYAAIDLELAVNAMRKKSG